MPAETATEPPARRLPRHGRAAPQMGGPAPFIVDRQTIQALPTAIHKAIAEKLIAEGAWILKDTEESGAV